MKLDVEDLITESGGGAAADHLVALILSNRLNQLLVSHPEVGRLLYDLSEMRTNISADLADHPTIQAQVVNDGVTEYFQVGLLGVLNGLLGALPTGERAGHGYLVAHIDPDKREVLHFSVQSGSEKCG